MRRWKQEKKFRVGARETTWWLKVYVAFAEDPNLVPSTHIRWVTTASSPAPEGSSVSSRHRCQHPVSRFQYTQLKRTSHFFKKGMPHLMKGHQKTLTDKTMRLFIHLLSLSSLSWP